MLYPTNSIIFVGFISLIFCVTYFFSCLDSFTKQKNTEQQYLVIISSYRVQDSEPQVDLRVKMIVIGGVGL